MAKTADTSFAETFKANLAKIAASIKQRAPKDAVDLEVVRDLYAIRELGYAWERLENTEPAPSAVLTNFNFVYNHLRKTEVINLISREVASQAEIAATQIFINKL